MKKTIFVIIFVVSAFLVFAANNCLEFDGNATVGSEVYEYVNFGNISAAQGTSVSFSVWAKFDDPVNTNNFLGGIGTGGTERSWNLVHLGVAGPEDGSIRWIVNSAVDGTVIIDSDRKITDTDWHHYVGVYDGSETRVYIDGVSENNADQTGTIVTGAWDFYIGTRQDDFGPLNGSVDNARIYNRALSAAEVLGLYNSEISGPTDNLVAHWKFDEGTGQTAYDETTNDHDGTLGSTTGVDANDPSWVSSDAPLPVTLSSFTAVFAFNKPALYWSTQSEVDNMGWNIYRSQSSDISFSQNINEALIEGAGTTSILTEYSYVDEYPVEGGSLYWYWLESISYSGESDIHGPITLTVPYNGQEQNTPDLPRQFGLYQNYPNPFNPSTEISFRMSEDSKVDLTIYDIHGRKIITLLQNEQIAAEQMRSVVWDGTDANGKSVSSGIYLYQLNSGKTTETRRMLLVK